MMRLVTSLLAIAILSGCTALRQPEELAWQAIHTIDMAQTLDGSRDPCWHEANPITQRVIGRKPTTAGVIAYGIGTGALHALISSLLIDQGYERAYAYWQMASFANSSLAVGMNHGAGVRLAKRNEVSCQ